MKNWKVGLLGIAAAALISGPLMAQVDYSEDFESFTLHPNDGSGYIGDLGGGWLLWVNAFSDYPGCSAKIYDYGQVFPAPNNDLTISFIVTGATGQALNFFSDYANRDHENGVCIETNVYQEKVLSAADAGSYEFAFDTEVPVTLGSDVQTYGFIKLLDPNANYDAVLFQTVDTATAGRKTLTVDLDASTDGMVLQWGFANTASYDEPSGRVYDNLAFAPQQVTPPPVVTPPSDPVEGVPTLGTYGLLVLLLLMGGMAAMALVRRD